MHDWPLEEHGISSRPLVRSCLPVRIVAVYNGVAESTNLSTYIRRGQYSLLG
jgi:hypothetical protein